MIAIDDLIGMRSKCWKCAIQTPILHRVKSLLFLEPTQHILLMDS